MITLKVVPVRDAQLEFPVPPLVWLWLMAIRRENPLILDGNDLRELELLRRMWQGDNLNNPFEIIIGHIDEFGSVAVST